MTCGRLSSEETLYRCPKQLMCCADMTLKVWLKTNKKQLHLCSSIDIKAVFLVSLDISHNIFSLLSKTLHLLLLQHFCQIFEPIVAPPVHQFAQPWFNPTWTLTCFPPSNIIIGIHSKTLLYSNQHFFVICLLITAFVYSGYRVFFLFLLNFILFYFNIIGMFCCSAIHKLQWFVVLLCVISEDRVQKRHNSEEIQMKVS